MIFLIEVKCTGLPSRFALTTPSFERSYRDGLYCENLSGGGTTMYLDRVTSSWNWQTTGTACDRLRLWWADKPSAVQWSGSQLSVPALGQWYAVDITALYNAWQNGTYPNFGVQFRPVNNSNNNFDEFYSADYTGDPTLRPKLVIMP